MAQYLNKFRAILDHSPGHFLLVSRVVAGAVLPSLMSLGEEHHPHLLTAFTCRSEFSFVSCTCTENSLVQLQMVVVRDNGL